MFTRMKPALVALGLSLVLAGCEEPPPNRAAGAAPLQTVESVDVGRYMGLWYEIARLPNGFEEGCEGVTAEYTRRDDGGVTVVNTCRKGAPDGEAKRAEGRARIVDAESNSKLEVSFFGPFWGDYWIIDLADDYSLSIVSEPQGRYLWILARTPTISEETRAEALATLTSLGFDVSKLHWTQQPPA